MYEGCKQRRKAANDLAILSEKYVPIKKDFQHVVLEGTALEVGQQQGEILKKQSAREKRNMVFSATKDSSARCGCETDRWREA